MDKRVPEQRRGVPQGRHTHGLLAAGSRVVTRLFPGIDQELRAAGAVEGDILATGRWFFEGGTLAKMASGLDGFLVSRPTLENLVRQRVRAIPNVALREGCHVEEPVLGDGGRVTGVRIGDEMLDADLVVDATGRGSHTREWLAANGYEKPVEERVEVCVKYTTRLFRREGDPLNGDSAVVVPPTPLGKRGAVLLAQEDDRWTVTLVSHFQENPPSDLEGFIEFARGLGCKDIYDVISRATPIGDAQLTSFPASVRRRYESLARFPSGFLVIGDGICSFNPIYGQGMSAAALEAVELGAVLESGTGDLARRFFARASTVIDMAWSIAVGGDLRIPETVGPRNAGVAFVNWYLEKLHRAAHTDPVLSRAFLTVANLLAPPPSVMHPRLILRVLRAHFLSSPRLTEAPSRVVAARS